MALLLREELKRQGVISFSRFMEQSLYHPVHGYYERAIDLIGRRGDYYTSASTGALFGQMLAYQFAEWLAQLSVRPVQLVEAGAHHGGLAAEILAWLELHRPELWDNLQYWILEPSAQRQAFQRRHLENFAGKILWADVFAALPQAGINGIIFSNELMDAMPVRRVGWDREKRVWFEWGVALEDGCFVWERMAVNPEELVAELTAAGLQLPTSLLEVLPDGFTVDLCPEAAAWWKMAAIALGCGRLLTLDYGLEAEQFLAPERAGGTLRGYHRHHLSNPLADPGEQDLTSHVNFTQLQRVGEAAGLRTAGLFTQRRFLTGIAKQIWQTGGSPVPWTPSQIRQFQTLTHPEHLGHGFKVLIQSRGGSSGVV